mmetsp:Transcript_15852/g.37593  ORF Transcript_15852/g.37593 Transcript_15852/m.37593 type:complete len:94 (-) Transcript_15852:124-405(-)
MGSSSCFRPYEVELWEQGHQALWLLEISSQGTEGPPSATSPHCSLSQQDERYGALTTRAPPSETSEREAESCNGEFISRSHVVHCKPRFISGS